ncbi:MAG: DUF2490 domain-containing protein [Flavobacteriales bacterium]|jgi:hypothetical protein|nr:DUF2490 domain-containing protein [Flavobacteriales bacterium]
MKWFKKLFYLLFIFFYSLSFSLAQGKIVDQQELAWNNFSLTKKIDSHISLRGELSIRRANFYKNWQQFLMRGMFYYHLKPQLKLGIGSSYIQTFPYGKQPILTSRTDLNLFEQLLYQNKLQQLSLTHNFRLEHFFREQFAADDHGHIYKTGMKNFSKVRYQFTVKYPIHIFKNKDKVYLKLFDELHFSTTNQLKNPYFQQNRYYIGLGYRQQHLNFTIGYKNQRIYKSDKIRIENNRMLDIGINYTL